MGGENLASAATPASRFGDRQLPNASMSRPPITPSGHLGTPPWRKRVLELSYLPDPIAPLPVKAMERADRASHRKGERKSGLIKYRLIGKHAQLTADGIGRRGCQLGHHDDGHILLRVDPERGRSHTAPSKFAARADNLCLGGVEHDRKTQAKADAVV